jgi:hypothetical protein
VIGVLAPDEPPTFHELLARRYRCTACDATSTVVPADVLPRKHFGALTIALAFAAIGACSAKRSNIASIGAPSAAFNARRMPQQFKRSSAP